MKTWKILLAMSICAVLSLGIGLSVSSHARKEKIQNGKKITTISQIYHDSVSQTAPFPAASPSSPVQSSKPVKEEIKETDAAASLEATPRPTLDLDSMMAAQSAAPSSPSPTVKPTPDAQPSASPAVTSKPRDYEMPKLSISAQTLPPESLKHNHVVDLKGVISCDKGVITEVRGSIISNGNAVQTCTYKPNTQTFSLAGTVNASLHFATLDTGSYVYEITAYALNGDKSASEVLISSPFEVVIPKGETYVTEEGDSSYVAKKTSDTDNAGQTWNYLIDCFNNPYAAAGIMSNIQAESSFNPNAGNSDFSSSNSYGICQWGGERKEKLKKYADDKKQDVSSLSLQLDYMMYELNNCYPSLKAYLQSATSGHNAAIEFCLKFEQPESTQSRGSDAKAFLDKYAKP